MKIPAYLLLLFFLLAGQDAFSQREAAHWFFGDRAGLNFNSGIPVPQSGSLQTQEGSATISDRNGNLLFYTDGVKVYDRRHNGMPNGGGLNGDVSSTQSAIIVPQPGTPGIYFIFTVDKPDYFMDGEDPIDGVNYSIVNMSLNGGFGDVVSSSKNIPLVTYNPADPLEKEYKSSEKLSAVLHADGSSYWVVTHHTNKFYAFKVTTAGVNTTPVISVSPNNVPPIINDQGVNITAIGYMKISPDGKKLAAAFSSTKLGSERTGTKNTGKVFLYDFNDQTGQVSNEELLLFDSYPYGVEFSPKTTKLYITANNYDENDVMLKSELYQYDLENSSIYASQKIIHTSNNVAGALQLAIDGRIYRAGYPLFQQRHSLMSVIRNPEAQSNGVSYSHNSIDIGYNNVKLGLPPFIQSLFLNNFDFENLCYGDETHFFLTSDEPYTTIKWDFGDGNTATGSEVYHTYSSPGTYIVSQTRILNGDEFEPARKELTIVDIPKTLENFELVQCDTGENSTDGIATFNLQLAKHEITLGNDNTQLFFYESRNAAVQDTLNGNAIDDVYTNTSRDQVVYAKVTAFNSICYSITGVKLKTKDSIELNPEPAQGCDLGNGEAEFNFQTLETTVLAGLNLPSNIDLSFHLTEEDAAIGINPLPDLYTSAPKKVFIKAVSDGICYGAGSIELEITSFPQLQEITELSLCSSQFPLKLGSELIFSDGVNYEFKWSTGESTREIQVDHGGNFSVEIINPEIGCGRTLQFFIEEFPDAMILDVLVESNGEISDITVITNNEEGTLYSLDDIDGPFQEDPKFSNVSPGPHTVYVTTANSCGIVEREILVFGFPSFFTPNDDGYNDRWIPVKIEDEEFRVLKILIFDRYGKLLKELDPNSRGWDGTFNNADLPGDDYWFLVNLANGREFKGHFSLIR